MKRDEVLDWVGGTVQFVRENARLVLVVVVAVLVAGAIAGAVAAHKGREANRANRLLGEALADFEAPIGSMSPEPSDPNNPTFADETSRRESASAKFEVLHDEFRGRPQGAIAAAFLGELAAESGDTDRAEELWRQALAEAGDSFLAGRVQLNLILLARSQGRAEAAVEELRALQNSERSPLPADVVLYQLGGALEDLSRKGEAASAYERLVEDYGSSAYASEVRRKLDEL